MMPRTINNLGAMEVLSAMQKHIRRAEEREAMHCLCELAHTSKAYFSMAANRLELIAHEDIGLAAPYTVVFVATACEQARRLYKPDKKGQWRLILGNAVRLMCRSKKSREGDHFQAAIGRVAELDNVAPVIPDYAWDHHTMKGRRLKRGLVHFRKVSCKLKPAAKKDAYEDEAYEVWKRGPGGLIDAKQGVLS
jgi:replication-associated recombination protein RarA